MFASPSARKTLTLHWSCRCIPQFGMRRNYVRRHAATRNLVKTRRDSPTSQYMSATVGTFFPVIIKIKLNGWSRRQYAAACILYAESNSQSETLREKKQTHLPAARNIETNLTQPAACIVWFVVGKIEFIVRHKGMHLEQKWIHLHNNFRHQTQQFLYRNTTDAFWMRSRGIIHTNKRHLK